MRNKRLFILIVTVALPVLGGFKSPAKPIQDKPQTKNSATKEPLDKPSAVAKPPLDLTMPLKAADEADESAPAVEKSPPNATHMDDLFMNKPKTADLPFQLKGDLLISPEPEVEKKKTVDGAGITIDIKQ